MVRFMVCAWAFSTLLSSCQFPSAEPAQDSTSEQASSQTSSPATIVLSKLYTNHSYRNWLGRITSDSLVFVEAYGLDSAALASVLDEADGIVLTGGGDIHPGRYEQPDDTLACGTIDSRRDAVEAQLTDFVWTSATPCLGVCRGFQYLNVHTGGSLHPHLPDAGIFGHRGGSPAAHPSSTSDTTHDVLVTHSIAPAGISFSVGTSAAVISHHHQGINRLAEGWDAWAVAPDGLVEGIRWADTTALPFVVGVQWHPERSTPGPLSDPLGKAFLMAVKTAMKNGPALVD